jgi:hypothetical protein
LKMRSLFVLLVATALAAVMVSSAFARPPAGDDDTNPDAAPAVATVTPPAAPSIVARSAPSAACTSGAHSLSTFGSRLYPEMGNGGYTSQHTDLYLNYDALANLFLPGTRADLEVTATQCLSDLSFDFEQTNGHTADGSGPNMTVNSVEINGQPATFRFVQPTYPGDPNGQDDADPAAHAVSNANPVSATNPNPPACSPQVSNNTQNGLQCPANKLVVTPAAPIPSGTTFTVTVDYTGRPGVHTDGDGSTEGWFRIATAGSEGAFVTTEPVGNDSWMPMNNFPTAKPTYDIYDTTNIGKVAIGPGELAGYTAPVGTTYQPVPPPASNPADMFWPSGSVTWHWHSPERIANYLVENSIGAYDLSARTSPASGVQYWEAQASTITAAKKATNKTAMDNQEDIVNFQQNFDGPWPMTTDGIVVGTPSASFEEEMQGKITFAGGSIGPSLGTFNHENMHQWFGDNVSEASFNLTFWKEGFATLGEYLTTARGTPPGVTGGPAFEASLVSRFNGTGNYNTTSSSFWTTAPSNPTVGSLFTTSNTYTRPGTAYLALWEALTRDGMIAAMKQIQSTYAQGNITEQQEEDIFRQHLPVNSASCNARLTSFFTQWFDTAYPAGAGHRPQITGPGLNGPGFTCAAVSPASPDGSNGWYRSPVSLTWSGFPTVPAPQTTTNTGCVNETVSTDGTYSKSCGVAVRTSTTLAAAAAAAATNVKVASVAGLFVGNTITIDSTGANPETVTITAVGSVGPTGTGVTFTPALAFAHASGATADALVADSGPVSETFELDATAPSTAVTLAPTAVGEWFSPRVVTLTPSDATSGVAKTEYSVDGGAWTTYTGPFLVATYGPHTLDVRSTDNAGNVETGNTTTWGSDFTAAQQLDGLSTFVAGLGLDKGVTKGLQHELDEAGKKLGKPKEACDHLDAFLKQVFDQAGAGKPKLTIAQAEQLLSANQIEALLGCKPSPAAEQDVVELLGTIAGMGLDKPVADDLDGQVREIGKHVVEGNAKDSCHSLADLSKKIGDLRSQGKLTAAQAATLGDAVKEIESLLGC